MGITRKQARIAIENKLSIKEIQNQFDENFTEMHMYALYDYAYNYDIPFYELYGINVNYEKDSDDPYKMQVDIFHKPITNGELTNYDMIISKSELFDAFVNGTILIEEMINKYHAFKNNLSDKKKEDESEDDSDECCECDCCGCDVSDSESVEETTIKKLNQLIDLQIEETKRESKESSKIKDIENRMAQIENILTQLENRVQQFENFSRIGFRFG